MPKKNLSPTAECVAEAGDQLAGLLLFRIKHHAKISTVKRDGVKWVANTRDYWCADVPMSPKQYRRAIKLLRDRGIVETQIMRFGGQPMTHVRVLKRAHLDGPPGANSSVPSGAHSSGPSGANSYTGVLTGVLTDTPIGVSGEPQNHELKNQESKTMDAATKHAIGAGLKATDLIAGFKAQARTLSAVQLAAQKSVKISELELLWKQQVAKANPGHLVVWSQKKTGQLRSLTQKFGNQAPLAIEYLISDWAGFCGYAKAMYAAKSPPAVPDLWFALLYVEAFVNWYATRHAAQPELKSIDTVLQAPQKNLDVGGTQTTKEQQKPLESDPVATAADLDAIWKGLADA